VEVLWPLHHGAVKSLSKSFMQSNTDTTERVWWFAWRLSVHDDGAKGRLHQKHGAVFSAALATALFSVMMEQNVVMAVG